MAKTSRYTLLRKPLTLAAVLKRRGKSRGTYVSGVVAVSLEEVVESNQEGFNDVLSERLVGDDVLMDIGYEVVGHRGNTLHIKVTGDAIESLFGGDPGGVGDDPDEAGPAADPVADPVDAIAAQVKEACGGGDGALDELVHDAASREASAKNNEGDGKGDDRSHDAKSRVASSVNNDGLGAQIRYLLSQGLSAADILAGAKS